MGQRSNADQLQWVFQDLFFSVQNHRLSAWISTMQIIFSISVSVGLLEPPRVARTQSATQRIFKSARETRGRVMPSKCKIYHSTFSHLSDRLKMRYVVVYLLAILGQILKKILRSMSTEAESDRKTCLMLEQQRSESIWKVLIVQILKGHDM